MNFQTMNRQRKFMLIAAAMGIISVFLPWVTISVFGISKSINGFHGWGILVFLAFAVASVITLIGNQTLALEKSFWFMAMACGAIALLSVIIAIASSTASLDGGMVFVDKGIGAGIWMAIATAAAIMLFAWMYKSPADNLKSGFEGLKKSISIPVTSFSDRNATAANTYSSTKIIKSEKLKGQAENASTEENVSG
jgi:hypothetical protein